MQNTMTKDLAHQKIYLWLFNWMQESKNWEKNVNFQKFNFAMVKIV